MRYGIKIYSPQNVVEPIWMANNWGCEGAYLDPIDGRFATNDINVAFQERYRMHQRVKRYISDGARYEVEERE